MDVSKERKELEDVELNTFDGAVPDDLYAKLMACYLLENDLCSAKFLWKRAPESARSSEDGEMSALWTVGQHMWRRCWPAAYSALRDHKWSDSLQPATVRIEESIRARVLSLTAVAYTSISASSLSSLLGLSNDETVQLVAARDWTVSSDDQGGGDVMLTPVQAPVVSLTATDCPHALSTMAEYVSFLEL